MPSNTRQSKTRSVFTIFSSILSVLTQAALFGIIITLAVVDLHVDTLQDYILATSILDGLLVLTLLALVARVLSNASPPADKFVKTLLPPSCALTMAATVLSLYVLANTWNIAHSKPVQLDIPIIAGLVVTGIAVCAASIIAQSITYILLTLSSVDEHVSVDTVETRQSTSTSSPKRFSVNLRALTAPISPSRIHLTNACTPSLNSLHSLKSSRQGSVSQVFGPLGSKTKLLITHSLHPQLSQSQLMPREASLEIACRGDVDEIASHDGPHELSSSPPPRLNLNRTMLETIPGSRPVSPARPLDGPYVFNDVVPEDFPLPASPTLSRATSPVYASSSSPSLEHHLYGLPFPPMIGEYASQSYIHPLFRSGSPGTPPCATSGTKVTASPYAGQVVSPEHVMTRKLKSDRSRTPTPRLSPAPSMERVEMVPNFSRPGATSRNGSRKADMF